MCPLLSEHRKHRQQYKSTVNVAPVRMQASVPGHFLVPGRYRSQQQKKTQDVFHLLRFILFLPGSGEQCSSTLRLQFITFSSPYPVWPATLISPDHSRKSAPLISVSPVYHIQPFSPFRDRIFTHHSCEGLSGEPEEMRILPFTQIFEWPSPI